jgi:hypothetical protein
MHVYSLTITTNLSEVCCFIILKSCTQLRNHASISDRGKRFFSPPISPDQFLGPPNLLYSEMEIFSLGVKHLEHDDDHSPPFLHIP